MDKKPEIHYERFMNFIFSPLVFVYTKDLFLKKHPPPAPKDSKKGMSPARKKTSGLYAAGRKK